MYDYRMLRRHLFCFLTTCPQCYMNVIPPSLRRLPLMYEIDRATQSQDLSGRVAKSTAPMNQFKYGLYRIQRLQRLTLTQAQNLSWQAGASGHVHRHRTYRGSHLLTVAITGTGPIVANTVELRLAKPPVPFLHLRPYIARKKQAGGFPCIINRPVKFEVRL